MSKYDDIINLPHYEPKNHKRMSIESRSAQFAPFSALTGYEDEVRETARLTEKEIVLTNDQRLIINEKLNFLKDKDIYVKVIYFIKDKKKSKTRLKHFAYIAILIQSTSGRFQSPGSALLPSF